MSKPPPPSNVAASSSPLLGLLITVALVIVAVLGWYLVDHSLRGRGQAVTWHAPEASCDLHRGPCTARLGERGRLEFAIDGEIRPLAPLPLLVRLEGVDAASVTVEFVGQDMPMGLHRFRLEARGSGRYGGQGQISICTREVMPWQARVVVETARGRQGSRFDFAVDAQSGF